MEERYVVPGGTISIKGQKSTQARKKMGNGFEEYEIPCEKTALDLRLESIPEDKWPSVYTWLQDSLASPVAFDGSTNKLQNKGIYAIAEVEGLMPKGFCRIHQTCEGKYSARKIGSILSQERIGRKVDTDWHTIQNQLERRTDFGYKEYVISNPKLNVSYLEGHLNLWRKERDLNITSIYGPLTEDSAIKHLFNVLDISSDYF
jgi:hypothetical protein